MFTFKELDDFSCYENIPLPLLTLCAKACVLYSEHLLRQLESVVLPSKISRLLVETHQQVGCSWNGSRSRFFSALKDMTGMSPWVFPGEPLVFPDSLTGTPDMVCLQYDEYVDSRLLDEIKRQEERISGLMCALDNDDIRPSSVKFSKLTKLVTDSIVCFAPSTVLVHLHLQDLVKRKELQLLRHFPNLEWLAIHCIDPDNYDTSLNDLSPLFVLSKLKHLDLQHFGRVPNAAATLLEILTTMPDLEYLDISGTNLDEEDLNVLREFREARPLKFLGLYRTEHNGCRLPNIPADAVSSNDDIQQRTVALENTCYTKYLKKILENSPSSTARFNYIIRLLQRQTWKHKLFFFLYCETHGIPRFIDTIDTIDFPLEVLTVLFDTVIHYVQQLQCPLILPERERFYPFLLYIVHKTCSMNPSHLGRTLAHFLAFCWNSTDEKPLHCDVYDLNKAFDNFFDFYDDGSICIVDIVNCQLKNVVICLESRPCYGWDKTTGSRMCVIRKVYNFVTRLFEKVSHPSIDECKHLFAHIEAWEHATSQTVPTGLHECRSCKSGQTSETLLRLLSK